MKHLSHRLCKVAVLLEMLRKRREVSGVSAPVGVEIVQSGGVRTPAGQEGCSAGAAKCLLQSQQQRRI